MAEVDKIIIKYGAEISELKAELDILKKQLSGVGAEAVVSSAKTENALNSVATNVKGTLTSAFTALGGVIAGVFAVQRIGAFITSSIELATRTQEIKAEFDKLNNPGLLANLKKSTDGTLSNLKLMEVALRADKLGVPMDKLGKIMEFAKLRADALGKSTEELTDTLIQGIGVKGTRALVQVGISQEEFSKEVKKTGDYFNALDNIMTSALDGAGVGLDSVADKQDRLNASIADSKAAIGAAFLPTIDKILTGINKVITGWQMLADGTTFSEKQAYDVTIDYLQKKTTSWIDYQKLLINTQQNIAEANNAIANGSSKDEQEAKASLPIFEMRLKALQLFSNEYYRNRDAVKTSTDAIDENKDANEQQTEVIKKQVVEIDSLAEGFKALGQAIGLSFIPLTDNLDLLPEDKIELLGIQVDTLSDAFLDAEGNAIKLKPAIKGVNDEVADGADNELPKGVEAWQEYGQAVFNVIRSITDYYQQASDYRMELLDNELAAGKISQGQYDKDAAELRRKEAVRTKVLALFDIAVNTPSAVMKSFAELGPAGAILATAAGILQLGAVLNTPIPKFKHGIVGFKGKGSDTSDENLVAISNNESIINANATRKHKGVLEAINKGTFEEYIANVYLKKAFDKKTASNDSDYREFLELKRLGLINKNGFKSLEKVISQTFKQHRY